MQNKKIAFVYHPHAPEFRRLDTMPFAMNVLQRLARLDLNIDLFLWEASKADYSYSLPKNISLKYKRSLSKRLAFQAPQLAVEFIPRTKYACVLGVGQPGSFAAGLISFASACPLIIINDEFPSCYGPPNAVFSTLERWAARRSDLIILPSKGRHDLLCKELRLVDKPHLVFPNITKVEQKNNKQDWHKAFGISEEKSILLYAGFLSDWSQVPELLSSVAYWPDNTVLLMNSKDTTRGGHYRNQISHLDLPGKVFWTDGALSEAQLNSLTAYCAASFALYRNDGPNTESIGMASGKLMRSVALGTPVITSSFQSLSFVTEEKIGVQVEHPSEIPAAVSQLLSDKDLYRANCFEFAAKQYQAEEAAWNELLDIMDCRK